MYKKYCLIVSILLIIPIFTTSMEVEEKQQRIHILEMITGRSFFNIHIQTSDKRSFIFHSDHPLFSQSTFFRPMIEGGFQEKGTKSNPIILRSINGNQLELIVKFIEIKTKPTKPLKQYLQDFDINQLIETTNFFSDIDKLSKFLENTDFLGVKGILEFMVPHLVKYLQDPNLLNKWLQSGGNELLGENEELSDRMKQNLTRKIIKIILTPQYLPQYLQQKKSIPFDVLAGHKGFVKSVAFSPDGKILASGSVDGTIKLWNVKTGTEIRTFTGHKGGVYSVAFISYGTILASGSADMTIKFWNVETGTEIHTPTGHTDAVLSVEFSPDNTILASGSADVAIKFWNVETGTEIHTPTPTGHKRIVFSVAFSPDGTILASGSVDGEIKFWNVETGTEIRALTGHKHVVYSVEFSPDGTILASGSADGTIKLWDVKTGAEIYTFTGHKNFVYSLAFNPDGTILVSGSADRTIKFWNVATGTEIHTPTPTGHKGMVFSVAFSPDGTILASGSADGIIRLWHLIDLQEIEQLSTLELLLIHAWQHAGIINLQTYQELNTIYDQASDSVKKLIKTLTP